MLSQGSAALASLLTEVRRSPRHGLGVFARVPIAEGETIEWCPVLVFGADDATAVETGPLAGYVYSWSDGQTAVALGHGSLYNHDQAPNAMYLQDDEWPALIMVATRPIDAGREITIDYTGGGTAPLWFTPD